MPTTEDDVFVPRVDGDCLIFKQDTASMVTQWPNAHYIMMELGHDVTRYVGGGFGSKRSQESEEVRGGPPVVPTRILGALVLMLAQGAFCVK